jgi:hypothetical protein
LPPFGSRRAARLALEGRAGAPILVPVVLTALVLSVGYGLLTATPALRGALESPEAQVKAALLRLDTARLENAYGHESGGLAELTRLHFSDVTVTLEGERATVVAMAEGEGRVAWRGQVAGLAYVGREVIAMRPCRAAGWCSEAEALAELRPILRLLFRRLDAFNGRDPTAYGRLVAQAYRGSGGRAAILARLEHDLAASPPAHLSVTAWQVRVERDQATVGEDEALQLAVAGTRTLRARLTLSREDGRWVIADGL